MMNVKRLLAGAALAAAVAVPLVTPTPAQAWWHAGWGWHPGFYHPGWGWHGGVYVGLPAVAVGVPVAPAPYAAAPYYAAPYRWVPAHYAPNGAYVPGHWGY